MNDQAGTRCYFRIAISSDGYILFRIAICSVGYIISRIAISSVGYIISRNNNILTGWFTAVIPWISKNRRL